MNRELRAAREKSGKTQARVAREVGVSAMAYQRYEYEKREPGVRTAIRIAKALGVKTLAEFYSLWEPDTPK